MAWIAARPRCLAHLAFVHHAASDLCHEDALLPWAGPIGPSALRSCHPSVVSITLALDLAVGASWLGVSGLVRPRVLVDDAHKLDRRLVQPSSRGPTAKAFEI